MAQDNGMARFIERFKAMQAQRETSDTLIKDVLMYCDELQRTLGAENQRLSQLVEETKLDFTDAVRSGYELQKQVEACQKTIRQKDYYQFDESYVRQGLEGGKKAAYALRNAVAQQCETYAGEMEISAKVVANIQGLGRAMVRDGSIYNEREFKDFTLGFSQAKAAFDFVDIGHGKERADAKIRVLADDYTRRRVSILEGVPTVPALVATNVNIFRMDNELFRTRKLGDRGTLAIEYSASSVGISPRTASATTIPTPPPQASQQDESAAYPSLSKDTPKVSPTASWAGLASKPRAASPPPKITLPLAARSVNIGSKNKAAAAKQSKKKMELEAPDWNLGPRGMDDPIHPNLVVLEEVKKRKDTDKLCNNHFLRGPCAKQDVCVFVHDYNPTDDELDAIAYLTRLNPCTRGQDCDNWDCIYGHHCASMKGNVCTHPYCKFPVDAHPPNTKFKNPHIDKNN
ncbi:uncharacterized protein J7T54_003737 [Emericellopsis cladophorae]|uniref:C3H1-type domain-containing protein n=1 Tax=Emericellopsis cladophorae TaxID=2686198 RepID=A0A9P9XY89_9HYPO|nr:uncharacterized protein J7T54_003737 [Emericellopsis cladophorae]KAI6779813.1 hypothetical protein J7T54_003737 [Emericellopsis cladophorae]